MTDSATTTTAPAATMSRFAPTTDPHGLTMEQLRAYPALFATAPHPKMSKKYTFLSTADVIEPLLKRGYAVTHVAQRATRFGHRDPRFTRHLVRLRRLKDKPIVGDVFPEVHISNSHDGQSRWILHGGLLRLACLNGMAISTIEFKGVSLIHRGELETLLKQIGEGVTQAAKAGEAVEKMSKIVLTEKKQLSFAHEAAKLVFDYKYGKLDFDTRVLLTPRREEDNKNDLWTVYNRVQENLIRGKVEIDRQTSSGTRHATTRGITHIRREVDVNIGLWQLASRVAA
jgi:Domain of unknown function (DUF932)